jgi:hypothetical protein
LFQGLRQFLKEMSHGVLHIWIDFIWFLVCSSEINYENEVCRIVIAVAFFEYFYRISCLSESTWIFLFSLLYRIEDFKMSFIIFPFLVFNFLKFV